MSRNVSKALLVVPRDVFTPGAIICRPNTISTNCHRDIFYGRPHRMRNFSIDPSKRTARVSRDIKTHCCRESRPFRIDYIIPTVRSSSIGRAVLTLYYSLLIVGIYLWFIASHLQKQRSPSYPARSFCLRLLFAFSICLYGARNIRSQALCQLHNLGCERVYARSAGETCTLCTRQQTSDFYAKYANTSTSSPAAENP